MNLVIGALALRMAFGRGGRALGIRDAVFVLWRIGTIPLLLVAIGVVGHAAWRFIQTFADTERKGRSIAGWLVRIGFALNGLFWVGLAPLAVQLALGLGADPRDPTRETAARMLTWTGGRAILFICGALLVYSAIAQWVEMVRARFAEDFEGSILTPDAIAFIVWVGRFGIGARAIVFAVMGAWIMRAALDRAPHEAKGLGESFAYLRAQPWGGELFAFVAFGILAYSWFSFEYARHRRIAPAPSRVSGGGR